MDLKTTSKQWRFFILFICSLYFNIEITSSKDTKSATSLINSSRDYFKACQHELENWKIYNPDQSQKPSHPIPSFNSVREEKVPELNSGRTPPCRSYKCLKQSDTLDLEKLRDFPCENDFDCAQDISAMICSNHSISSETSNKYCSCPHGYAYSTIECRCKPAELCWETNGDCYKGMKCQEPKCSCHNLERLLYEIHGGFCIEPRSTHLDTDHLTSAKDSQENQLSGASGPEIVIVSILAAIVILGLIAIGLYILSVKRKDIDFCARGDYVCDNDTLTPGNRANQPHVAAWDAPGMDFLSEEQTLKYLNRSNSIEVGTLKSPSVATTAELVDEAPSPSGSLPECEQNSRQSRIHQIQVETNFENPTFNASRHSSESKDSTIEQDETSSVTKSSNIL